MTEAEQLVRQLDELRAKNSAMTKVILAIDKAETRARLRYPHRLVDETVQALLEMSLSKTKPWYEVNLGPVARDFADFLDMRQQGVLGAIRSIEKRLKELS